MNKIYKIVIIAFFALVWSMNTQAQVAGTPYLVPLGPTCFSPQTFNFVFSSCALFSIPDSWENRNGTPTCSNESTLYTQIPSDADDELVLLGLGREGVKKDVSCMGLVAGTQITISITASLGLETGVLSSEPPPDNASAFEIHGYTTNPAFGNGCGGPGGGQLLLTGANGTRNVQTFNNTVTLTQNTNWITITSCSQSVTQGAASYAGAVQVDDLLISW